MISILLIFTPHTYEKIWAGRIKGELSQSKFTTNVSILDLLILITRILY